MMIRTPTPSACAALLVLALGAGAGAAGAQTATGQARPADQADQLLSQARTAPAPPPVNDGEAYHRAEDSEQTPEELRTTRALNDEIASRNQLAENQEQADRAKHEAAVTAATQAQLAYEEDLRRAAAAQTAWEAEQARWQAERARWEADVRACNAGDRTRCSTPARY
jgi:hypothetical protein